MDEALSGKLAALPASPGVYVFKGADGATLYVGKASSLRARVRSYFQHGPGDPRYFIGRLSAELADVQTFVTTSEKEAALLENRLIKEHQPRYNVKLRDDKDFLSLRIDPNAEWPRLEVVRRPQKDGCRYFGPYHSASAARSTLRLVNRHFQLRTCTDSEFRSRTRPCLQYQIKRCPAPCVYEVDRARYEEQVHSVGLFLEGRHDELCTQLERQMRDAAERLDYELAAIYRDQIRAVESVRQKQRVSLVSDVDQDVFGYYREQDKVQLAVLMARHGQVIGVRSFALRNIAVPTDELLASFVGEYYRRGTFVPDEILLPVQVEAASGLQALLTEQRGARTTLLRPQRGHKARLLRMAMENAAHAYRENARATEDVESKLQGIMHKLGLPRVPRHIECIDVSHTSGIDTVAVIAAVKDGEPHKKSYRSFHLRAVGGGDDYRAMSEVLGRRFVRGKQDQGHWGFPDLLVVDGGKGQLNIALEVLGELDIDSVPVVALAKEKESPTGEQLVDRVYLPGRKNAIELKQAGHTLHLLALARDEAHRASNVLRTKVHRKRTLRSGLDDIRGVGPKTRRALLRNLGSLKAIKSASMDELLDAGATRKQAEAIYHAFHPGPDALATDEAARAEMVAVDNAFVRE